MKKLLKIFILIVILILIIAFRHEITRFIIDKYIFTNEVFITTPNDYVLDYEFEYIKKTDDFYAKNYHDLLNILYTALNNGASYFYFFCSYDECEKDVDTLKESNQFVNINNYVHPYNRYLTLNISINVLRKVSITINQAAYDADDILAVNRQIDKIISEIITDDMSIEEKITAFHDYIIKITKYDMDYIDKKIDDPNSFVHTAVGPLLYGKALCGGYTDVMAIFLNKLKIPNYRISSENHIWNFVLVNNNWYHLDLTWDDPVTSNGKDILQDNFLLITTKELEKLETGCHEYDKTIYLEAN